MQKMTMTEASVIVGGTCRVCETSYELSLVGETTTCKAVKTCIDKYGRVTKNFMRADLSSCGKAG